METTISIPGMHCASCATLVKEVSGEFPSILSAEVDLQSKKVTLHHNEDFDMDAWTKEIESLGDEYKVINQ